MNRPLQVLAFAAFAAAMTSIQIGCNRSPIPKARVSAPTVVRDIPAPLRGTIGAEARVIGDSTTLVSGIGFVVGLDGTGGLPIPEQYAAHLERQMGLNGIGISNDDTNSPLRGRSPRQLLLDPNTAAVIVQAAIPPGANEGESYDVYVRAINATSLEGGKLWTTELRVGPPSAFGDPQARIVGRARGPLFLNPFAEPGAQGLGVTQTVGRILDGGIVTEPTKIQIILDSPSHQRVRQIVSAINSAYPIEIGSRDQTARGVDDSYLLVQIPKRFSNRREEFIQLIAHLTIDQSYPEVYAQRYASSIESQPYLASELAWCLQALGERSLPYLQKLYNYPEEAPRLSALRAGAGLGDPKCIEQLGAIATDETSRLQTDAIALLGRIEGSMLPDRILRGLLESDQLAIRIEAYEALVQRAINAQTRRLVRSYSGQSSDTVLTSAAEQQAEVFARVRLKNDPIRGISRELVDGKFFLDVVPFGDPLIYITQQREPRIVLFGDQQTIETPVLASAWSDRLMIAADDPGDPIRLYYRNERQRRTFSHSDIPAPLPGLVEFLATDPVPGARDPGLGLSYSEVVSALYQLHTSLGMNIGFTTESDQLLAELLKTAQPDDVEIRAEGPADEATMVPLDDPTRPVVENNGRPQRRTLLVPVNPRDDEARDEDAPPAPRPSPVPSDTPPMRDE